MSKINSSVNDIINLLPGSSTGRTSKLLNDLEDVKKQIPEGNKYKDRAELEKNGIGKEYDDLQSVLMFNEKYNTACNSAIYKLEMQNIKLDELSELKTKFSSKQDLIPGREKEFAEDILTKIEAVLNSQLGGEYIFGGKNSNIQPVADLNRQTNIVNGRASTNYTNATAVQTISPVSDKHSVNLTLISANDPAIASFIAAVNSFKSSEGHSHAEIDKFLQNGENSLGKLGVKMHNAIQNAQNAKVYNSEIKTSVIEQIAKISTSDVVELAEKAKAAVHSLVATFALSEINNNVSSIFFNR